MDKIKDIAKRIVDIIRDDDEFEEKFDRNPARAVEELFGIELPDEKLQKLIHTVKNKLDRDDFYLEDLMDKDNIPGLSNISKLPDV